MAVVVSGSDFDDLDGWMYSVQESLACSGTASVVAYLENSALKVVSGSHDTVFGFKSCISH
jgi:hypothetical protein